MSVVGTIGVREAYELWAPRYAQGISPLLALQERCLEPFIPPIRDRLVVDVACGTGRWLNRLAARGPKSAIGLDLSLAMLRRAKLERGNVNHLLCADGSALPLRDRCADFVLCSLALDHIPNLAAFIKEIARITDEGGLLLLSDFHPDAHARGWKRSFKCGLDTINLPVYPRHISTLHDALRRAGFWLQHCSEPGFGEPDRCTFEQAGREDLFDAAVNAGPAIYVARYVRTRRTNFFGEHCNFSFRSGVIARSPNLVVHGTVSIDNGRFSAVDSRHVHTADTLDLSGYMLLPGLINAHDHLEFSLYPRLGTGPYASASHWAAHIYRPDESPVREQLAIPKDVRLWWGALKNLLSGVTTVAHHNPLSEIFADPKFPVRVVSRYGWAHSFAGDSDVQVKFESTPEGSPFFIHLGEGVDHDSAAEFSKLRKIGALDARMVIVHGVALTGREHRQLQKSGAAVVWCPSSNYHLLGTTLTAETVMSSARIALGSDSCISGAGDFLDEIAIAVRRISCPERIYDLATCVAANVVQDGAGSISAGLPADFIAVRDHGLSPAATLARSTYASIELVVNAGRLRLISPELLELWPGGLPASFEPIVVEGVTRFLEAPVCHLLAEARRHLGPDIRLAGRRVWQ